MGLSDVLSSMRPSVRLRGAGFAPSATPGLIFACAALAVLAAAVVGAALPGVSDARDVKAELKEQLEDNQPKGEWIYDDADAAFDKARAQKKPLFLVFR